MPISPKKNWVDAIAETEQKAEVSENTQLGKADMPKYIDHALAISKLPKLTKEQKRDPVAVEERCQLYFELCKLRGIKPSNAGLAAAFRIDRATLYRARDESWGAESAEVLKHYANLIDLTLTNLAMDGKVHYSYASFLQKNNAGYSDRTELTVQKGDSLLSKEDLIKRAEQIDAQPETTTDPIEAAYEDISQNT